MNIDDITIVISAYKYPWAELCVESIRSNYPTVPIVIAFDEDKNVDKRKQKLSQFNVTFADDLFEQGHAKQLDRIIRNYVKTEYFITCDDDVIFYRNKKILDFIIKIINSENPDTIGEKFKYHENNVSPRILPCFFVMKKSTYDKYNCTFMSTSDYNINIDMHYDVGTFIYYDIVKYGLYHYDKIVDSLVFHLWRGRCIPEINEQEEISLKDLNKIRNYIIQNESNFGTDNTKSFIKRIKAKFLSLSYNNNEFLKIKNNEYK